MDIKSSGECKMIETLIEEKIKKALEDHQLDAKGIKYLLEVTMHDEIKKSCSRAINNAFDGYGIENQLRNTISQTFNSFNFQLSEIKEYFNKEINNIITNNNFSDKVDKLLEKFQDEINSLKTRFLFNASKDLSLFYKDIYTLGNIRVNYEYTTYENFKNSEAYIANKKNDDDILCFKFNKCNWNLAVNYIKKRNPLLECTIDNLFKNDTGIGAPDLICIDDNLIYFIEVKSSNDSIKMEQIKWAMEHPKQLIIYTFVCLDKEEKIENVQSVEVF